MGAALALSVVVVAYNNIINRWGPFHRAAYIPINLLVAGTAAAVAAISLDLSVDQLGLEAGARDVLLPLALVTLFALVALALASSRHGHRIADRRVTGMHGSALAFYVLARIPLGTAVPEELIFRGMLFAAWQAGGASDLVAALLSAIAFGLWHVSPTVIGLRLNDPSASRRKVEAAVAGAVILTTIAGLGLTWLRVKCGGLLGPIVLHAGINSVGALAAVVANRHSRNG